MQSRTSKRIFNVGLVTFAPFLVAAAVQAQSVVYVTADLTQFDFNNNGSTASKSDSGGFGVGGYYNFPIQSRFTAGIDVRGNYSATSRGGAAAAASLRFGFVPERVPLAPYLQVGGGFVTSTFNIGQLTGPATQGLTSQSTRYTNGALLLAAGLDVPVSARFDIRVLELGAEAGASPGSGFGFVDAGVVYHLRGRRRF